MNAGGIHLKNRAAYFGVFTALALIFSYLESLIPIRFGIPGIKLGLANLLTVILLYKRNAREALLLSVVRVILSGFLFGNLFSIVYSLAGGILSLFVMAVLKGTGRFSVMGVSAAGGVFHNMGQLLVAMAAVETYRVGYYFPVLLIAGVVTGLLIGTAAEQVLKRLGNFRFES
jgi:Predicted membrane protein